MKKFISLFALFGMLICFAVIPAYTAVADDETTSDISDVSTTDLSEVSEESDASNIPEPQIILYGDANGDGAINMKDILMIRKNMAHLETPGIIEKQADANGDHQVNMKDVLMIRKYMAHILDKLGPDIQDPKYTYYDNGSIETKRIYNGQDNLEKIFFYDIDGNLDHFETYTYDENDRLITQSFFNGEEVLTLAWTYTYYEDGSKDVRIDEASNHVYYLESYDPSGNMLNESKYDESDKILYHTTYTYDDRGNCLSQIYRSEDDAFESHYVWEFDENDRITSQYDYNESGDLLAKVFYYYSSESSTADAYYAIENYTADDILIRQFVCETYNEEPFREVWKQIDYSAEGKPVTKTVTTFVDNMEVAAQLINFDEEGNISTYTLSDFDENENLISEKTYDIEQVLLKEVLYAYDDNDELIFKTTNTYENGELVDTKTETYTTELNEE